MNDKAFANSDGDLLIVPQQGTLDVRTEMGRLLVPRGHIVVIPRGILFSVALTGDVDAVGGIRGYILECFTEHFNLPELGPIGSNGLANPRDFLHPTAAYEDRRAHFTVVQKYAGECFTYSRPHSPFNVVAWRGNYAPFMYDLNRFVPAGAIRIDHLDPSIFTVLTCPTSDAGVAAVDFVIFPPRVGRRRTHVPSAVVSPQHHERIHGKRLRTIRSAAGRLLTGRSVTSLVYGRTRTGRIDV